MNDGDVMMHASDMNAELMTAIKDIACLPAGSLTASAAHVFTRSAVYQLHLVAVHPPATKVTCKR